MTSTPDDTVGAFASLQRDPIRQIPYYGILFTGRERRDELAAILLFQREIRNSVHASREFDINHTKLHWWRDEVERLFSGKARHPASLALVPVLTSCLLPRSAVDALLDAATIELHRPPLETATDLDEWCARAGGALHALLAQVQHGGPPPGSTARFARAVGSAWWQCEILRTLRVDARDGSIWLPRDELATHGVTDAMLCAAESGAPLRACAKARAQRIETALAAAVEALPAGAHAEQRCGLITAHLCRELLMRLRNSDYAVLERDPLPHPLRLLWLAWRTAQRCMHTRS